MTAFDLLIRGGTVVTATGQTTADLAISDGRIAAIVAPGTPLDAATHASTRPGSISCRALIDVH